MHKNNFIALSENATTEKHSDQSTEAATPTEQKQISLASVYLSFDQSVTQPVWYNRFFQLRNTEEKPMCLCIVNTAFSQVVLDIQNMNLFIFNSTFHNSYFLLHGGTPCVSLHVDNSLFDAKAETNQANKRPAEFVGVSGDWCLITMNSSNFQAEETGNVSAVVVENGSVSSLKLWNSNFSNLWSVLKIITRNVTVSQLSVKKSEFTQNVQVFSLSDATVSQLSAEKNKFSLSVDESHIGFRQTFLKNETIGHCYFVMTISKASVLLADNVFQYNTVATDACSTGLVNAEMGNILISGCRFQDNVAHKAVQHSLLWMNSCNVSLANTEFVGNIGGCLFVLQSYVQIVHCFFEQNSFDMNDVESTKPRFDTSSSYGSVLLSNNSILVSKSSFVGNSARCGGVMFITNSPCQISSSHFEHNMADTFGGAVALVENCSLNVTSTTFAGNFAKNGGVLYAKSKVSIFFSSIQFENNSAISDNMKMVFSSWDNVVDKLSSSCTLHDDVGYGGVIFAERNVEIVVVECAFMNNTAGGAGCLFAGKTTFVKIQHSLFLENDVYDCKVSWYFLPVRKNYPSCGGGNSHICMNSTLVLDSSSFKHNSADWGAVLFATCFTSPRAKKSLTTGNTSQSISSCYHLNVDVANCTFVQNHAADEGGVVWAIGPVTITVDNSHFAQNSASWFGGVLLVGYDTDVSITNCSFTDNQAFDGGCVWASYSVDLYLDSSVFTNNSAKYLGGVLLANISDVTITNCLFSGNRGYHGGVMWASQSINVSILASHFSHNEAQSGGALFASDVTHIVMTNSNFFHHNVTQSGSEGGVFKITSSSVVNVLCCKFANNSAMQGSGGVMFASAGTDVALSDSSFTHNSAWKGGVVCAANTNLDISNTEFIHNVGTQLGAGLWCEKCVISVSHTLFAENQGSALVISEKGTNVSEIKHSLFQNNLQFHTTYAFGGDMFFSTPVNLKNITIEISKLISKSITCTQETTIHTLDIVIVARTSSPVAFFDLLTWKPDTLTSITLECPEYTKPHSDVGTLSATGVAALKISCEACSGYFTGDNNVSFVMSEGIPLEGKFTCQKQSALFYHWCFTLVHGVCRDCPRGADCTSGLSSLPDYWGYKTRDDQIAFVRCPTGYCCQALYCSGLKSCEDNREGVLCGRCKIGYAEAFLSQECVVNSDCINSLSFVCLYFGWIIATACGLLFLKDMKTIASHMKEKVLALMGKEKNEEDTISIPPLPPEIERERIEAAATFSKEGFFVVLKPPSGDADNSHKPFDLKYLQIVLYFVQDASIVLIRMPEQQEVTTNNLRDLLFNISELAVDLINMAKTTCVFANMTPLQKTIIKNCVGPGILLLYGLLYLIFWLLFKIVKKPQVRDSAYTHLATAGMFVLLMFYQKLAITTMSLVQCTFVEDKQVLFLDGTVDCYQMWQFAVFLFLCTWVVPFLLVLFIGPTLLETNKVEIFEFFTACLLPFPVLFWWAFKARRQRLERKYRNFCPWHTELVESLQKSFKDIKLRRIGYISWTGFIKLRRLILVVVFTFVIHLILRLVLMIVFIVIFLVVHYKVYPYKDIIANRLYLLSLFSLFLLGLISLVEVVMIEGLVELQSVSSVVAMCETTIDIIIIWVPVCICGGYTLFVTGQKVAVWVQGQFGKEDPSKLSEFEAKPKVRRASV